MRAVPLSDWRLFRFYRADIERVAAVPGTGTGAAAGGGVVVAAAGAEGADSEGVGAAGDKND
jgi:hypothetical protein